MDKSLLMGARRRTRADEPTGSARKSGDDKGIQTAAALAESLLATERGRIALRKVGGRAFFRQVIVRLLRLMVMRIARERGLWRAGAGISESWLFSRRAAPEVHTIRVRPSDAAMVSALAGEVPIGALGGFYESLLACEPVVRDGRLELRHRRLSPRKRSGSYFTPPAVVERLLDLVLGPALEEARRRGGRRRILELRVCDPACGAGNFLVPAMERIAGAASRAAGRSAPSRADVRAALECVRGMDLDPVAAELGRLSLWFGVGDPRLTPIRCGIAVGDSLLGDCAEAFPEIAVGGGFDVVVGNPPFLSQLSAGTMHARHRAAAIKARFGGAAGAYTDPAALFLVLATRLARPGGRVALLQPVSVLASRDARGARDEVLRAASLEGFWGTDAQVFDAGVTVCAPVLRIGGRQGRIRRWPNKGCPRPPDADAAEIGAGTWAPLLADLVGVPPMRARTAGQLGDVATATADFRDQYYGLRGLVVEDASLNGQARERFAPLVTSGLIDAGVCRWGAAATRFDGRSFEAPRVDLEALEVRTDLGPWARARRVPKVLLATQTPILEAAVDERGDWLPGVPVITVVPRPGTDLWRIAAVLLSPVATAWALRRYGGVGLSLRAIKLSARQVMDLPLPTQRALWEAAAGVIQRASAGAAGERERLLLDAGRLMGRAYEVEGPDSLVEWWGRRGGLGYAPRVLR